jgi:hypothetical protein
MNLGTSSPAIFSLQTSNIFVEAWIYLNSPLGSVNMIAQHGTGGGQDWGFWVNGSGNLIGFIWGNSGTTLIQASSAGITAGAWYHVAFSFDSVAKSSRVYINGGTPVTVTNAAVTPNYNTSLPFWIGNFSNSNYFNGYIRDLRVVQGGVVPVATFTPGAAPFSYASPSYVANMGTTVFTLLGQFVSYPSGKYGTSISFRNPSTPTQTNYISYSNKFQYQVDNGFSVSSWVKIISLPSSAESYAFEFNTSDGAAYISIYCGVQPPGNLFLQYYDGIDFKGLNLINPVVLNTWYHVVCTVGSGRVDFYLDNVNKRSITYTPRGRSIITGFLGKGCDCELDDLRIYNTALTAAQVQSVYSSQGAPAPSRAMPLPKLAWDFNGTTTDYVSGLTGTVTGTESYGTGINKQGIVIANPSGTAVNYVKWNIGNQVYINNGFTYSVWVNFTDLSLLSTSPVIMAIRGSVYTSTIAYRLNAGGAILSLYWQDPSTYKDIIGPVVTANKWYNFSTVFINGNVSLYVNGVTVGTSTYDPYYNVALNTSITVGSFTNPGTPFIGGVIDDLRIFDRALTSAQVQSIYNQQGVPGRGANGLSLPLDKVSGQVAGAYSTRLIRSAYTGPVVRVRRNSDSTQLDFISDVTGNLSNVSSAVSIASWLSATTGNVSTWYDQSGGSNNFTQSITSQQPQIVQNGGKWVVWFNRDATPTFYSNLNCATTMTGIKSIIYNFNLTGGGYQTILGAEQSDNTGFRFNGNSIIGDATGGRLGSDFLAAAGSYWYLNGAYGYTVSNDGTTGVFNGNYTYTDGVWNHVVGVQNGNMDGFGFNAISSPQLPIKFRAMNGFMSEIILFRNQLSAADSLYLYNSRYISRGSQIALTGTPLFSQLSQSARTSAVGAFSLRAVNATTARAVNVVAGGTFPIQGFSTAATQSTNQFTQTLTGYPFTGSYTANCSSFTSSSGTEQPWRCFDKNNNGTWWTTNEGSYSTSTGLYTAGVYSTTISGSAYSGEWIQIQLPAAIILTSYTIYNASSWNKRAPNTFKLAGSNDGTTWTLVDTQTGITSWASSTTSLTFTPSAQTIAYAYYRLCVNQVQVNADFGYLSIGELVLNGTVPSLAQDFYADRLGNLLTAPVTGQSLANWLGGATGYVTTWYDQSGKGNHATQATAANQPVIQRATKGPGYMCLFNGTQFLTGMSHTVLKNTNYSFSIVERRKAAPPATGGGFQMPIIANGTSNSLNNMIHVAYNLSTGTNFISAQYGTGTDATSTITAFASSSTEPIRYLFGAQSSVSGTRTYVYNDPLSPVIGSRPEYTTLSNPSAGNFYIGVGYNLYISTEYYTGEMYEVLVFTRSLFDLDGTTSIAQIYQNQLGVYGT